MTGMSVVAGWYRDPAGSADLRWWDGQTWTTATTATTAAVTASAAARTSPSLYQAAPNPYASERSYSYGAARFSPAKPWYRRPLFLGLVGAVAVAAVLLGAGVLTVAKQSSDAKSLASRTTIQMPETVVGIPRLHDAVAAEHETRMGKVAMGPFQAGAYGTSTTLAAEVYVVRYTTAQAGVSRMIANLERGANERPELHLNFSAVDPGPLGGQMVCASFAYKGFPEQMCFFADQAVHGSILLYADYAASPSLPRAFRAAMEVRH